MKKIKAEGQKMEEQIKNLVIELEKAIGDLNRNRVSIIQKYRIEIFNKKKKKLNEQAIFENGIKTGLEVAIKKLEALKVEKQTLDKK